MKTKDEDNCLTSLCHCWLQLYRGGTASTLDELIIQLNQMSERFGGYTTKTYNILALALIEKQDFDRALKIFENALSELALDTEAGQDKHLTAGNQDLACLLHNYIKCRAIRFGFAEDKTIRQLMAYLEKMESPVLGQLMTERSEAEAMFDQAVKTM